MDSTRGREPTRETSARSLAFTIDAAEAEIILAALETECEIYRQSTRDAIADGSHDLATALRLAADRIFALRARLTPILARQPPPG